LTLRRGPSIQTKMSLVATRIYCTISPPLSGEMEDCFIVRVQQLQMLYRRRCCMSASQRLFGSLQNIVVAYEHRRQDGSRRLGMIARNKKAQLSPTNPCDAKACPKLLQFDVLTTLSLQYVYLHSFSCCYIQNLRIMTNSLKIQTYTVQGHRFGANQKRTCTFLLAINSNFERISFCFRDIDAFSSKNSLFFPPFSCLTPPSGGTP